MKFRFFTIAILLLSVSISFAQQKEIEFGQYTKQIYESSGAGDVVKFTISKSKRAAAWAFAQTHVHAAEIKDLSRQGKLYEVKVNGKVFKITFDQARKVYQVSHDQGQILADGMPDTNSIMQVKSYLKSWLVLVM